MRWDYPEPNPFSGKGGSFDNLFDWTIQSIPNLGHGRSANSVQADAGTQHISLSKVLSTDPPYYDNIGYADLSDFFYVWLRRSLRSVFPDLFATMMVPKAEELVATPYRHGTRAQAEASFMTGMTQALERLARQTHPGFPVTIYYAFKQAERRDDRGVSSTGWETFLEAVIAAGFAVTGTWPMRTELGNRMVGRGANALASSIVLVCRRRPDDAPLGTRRRLAEALREELPPALAHLQRGNVAPVDLAQAAIGPGMAIFTRYARVLHTGGDRVTVREALALINQTLDEILAAQEGDFDADSRWALAWFDQHGFEAGDYGTAETLSKAKNTSVSGLAQAGILHAQAGRVRLLRPDELPDGWDPAKDERLTTWGAVHHLIRVKERSGEEAAARLLHRLAVVAGAARELCYRLYAMCERKQRTAEAFDYNGLVKSWPELARLAVREAGTVQAALFADRGAG